MALGARLLAACYDLADDLTAAGVPASVDRSKVSTPGAWVTPASLDTLSLGGDGTARVDVVLVVAPGSDTATLTALADLLDRAMAGAQLVAAEPVDTSWVLQLPHSPTPLPAFRLPVDLDL
jgi:hypothetical protein